MIKQYKFTLYIDPKAKKRPKVYRWSTVNPSQEDEELAAQSYHKISGVPETPLKGQLCIGVKFFKNPPKNTPKWKLPLMEKGLLRPNISPDLDNYVKLILDALNGLLWEDDRYIVEMHSAKYYTLDRPRIDLVVEQLPFAKTRKEAEEVFKDYSESSIDQFFTENQS